MGESGLKIIAAFWSPSEDEGGWDLVVVSPDVAEKGAPAVYKQAHVALYNLDIEPPRPLNFWWDRIKIISPLIYRNLKQRVGTGDSPVRPGWALDSYIYKME